MWVSHAERLPQADELCHALAVKLGSTDFDVGHISSMSTLVSCCQGLITVDKEASTVRLIHFTLQEYLSSRPDIFSQPHSAMAEICLTYLNSRQVKALSSGPDRRVQETSFLIYCSVYWGVHAKRELTDSARSLALEVLKGNYGRVPTKLLLTRVDRSYSGYSGTRSPFSGLHCALFFGIVEVVAGLIKMECYDINKRDSLGYGPIAWAARYGHEEVVKILLEEEEVSPDKRDKGGRTPLSHAAENGYGGVVKILLGRGGVSPDKPDKWGQTPLSHVAQHGHEDVVKILLGWKEVNPDQPDSDGRTPLSHAARHGHEGVVKILLGREQVNPDKPDKWGLTPLSRAACSGYEEVVKILLGREEVNPNKSDGDGRTPLWYAARNEYKGVVKILLGREEVNPDKPDNDRRKPLWYAARHGRKRVVVLLESHKAATSSTIQGRRDTAS